MKSMDEIYQKYARMVYKYLLSLTHDTDVAEEITQETFYQAIRSIERYDESCSISTWLCAIAKNQLLTYQRKHPKMNSLDEMKYFGVSESLYNPENLNNQESHGQTFQNQESRSAEDNVLSALDRVELMKKLHLCPEPFREVMYLRIFGNLSFKEIGEIMGRTENWARVTFYRGKEKLRKEIVADEK